MIFFFFFFFFLSPPPPPQCKLWICFDWTSPYKLTNANLCLLRCNIVSINQQESSPLLRLSPSLLSCTPSLCSPSVYPMQEYVLEDSKAPKLTCSLRIFPLMVTVTRLHSGGWVVGGWAWDCIPVSTEKTVLWLVNCGGQEWLHSFLDPVEPTASGWWMVNVWVESWTSATVPLNVNKDETSFTILCE